VDRWWVVVMLAVALATAEWLRGSPLGWAWLSAGFAAVAAVLVLRRRDRTRWLLASLLTLLAAQSAMTALSARAIDRQWPTQRERRLEAYGNSVGGELRRALRRASRLARIADAASSLERAAAFRVLEAAVPAGGAEMAVAILDQHGAPWAWAGRQRLPPQATGDSVAVRVSGNYVLLETRRHSAGGTSVASVLIWADSAIADRDRSVAERFRRSTEVGILVHPAGADLRDEADVFDYAEPTTAGDRLLFSVQPVPPSQGEARGRVLLRGGRVALALAVVAMLVALAIARSPASRTILLAGLLWIAARAPAGELLGLPESLGTAALRDPLLGPFSESAGALALTGLFLLLGAVWLWRRAARTGVTQWMAAIALTLLSAAALWHFGGALVPARPALSLGQWVLWQLSLVLIAAPFAVAAAALLRGTAHPWTRHLPVVGAVLAAVLSFVLTLTWGPGANRAIAVVVMYAVAIGLAVLPARVPITIAAIAATLGAFASLELWRAHAETAPMAAETDVSRLAQGPDPFAVPALAALARDASASPSPSTAADLYALWQGSELARKQFPVELWIFADTAGATARLALDSLSVPGDVLHAIARELPDSAGALDIRLVGAAPGAHHVLAVRLPGQRALVVVAAPRTALVARSRLGHLLAPGSRPAPGYRLLLGPRVDEATPTGSIGWSRDGRILRLVGPVPLPGGVREVTARVTLSSPYSLAVRGTLFIVLDLSVLGALWLAVRALSGASGVHLGWRRLLGSFRLRLALALAFFFVLPTVAFAIWSFSHFGDEARRGRDLLIAQTLRDAAQGAQDLLRSPGAPVDQALAGLGERVNADLALYRGGSLVAASAPVLGDLGIIPPLMDPGAFQALALAGEQEVMRTGEVPELADRVGFRVVEFGPPSGLGVLATPQPGTSLDGHGEQRELAFVMLLATLAGIAAAAFGARVASRALSRPVADLRRAAIALGQGEATPLPTSTPPVEFEPVFGAFQRMAADVRASQAALEQARRRTATVLATVTTGVVALDPDGRVMLANRRARELLECVLTEGDEFGARLASAWAEVGDEVTRALRDPATIRDAAEFTVGERRVSLEIAPLGTELSGIVLAMTDVTDVSRAERVLAWGDMARQVAHEIKNPLTPLRLGIQHLQRVYKGGRADFGAVLDETSVRILSEIDRLDTIARAFSRFAAPPEAPTPLETVDLGTAAAEVVQLYALAGEGEAAEVRLEAAAGVTVAARKDEVTEVLVNLLENARAAGAKRVQVRVTSGLLAVRDDGVGIPAELLPRIFEPQFSTNTSGSGLGLAIVKRLVESWGATVTVKSGGAGTVAEVRFRE
jgi:signal transduction histidine kinase